MSDNILQYYQNIIKTFNFVGFMLMGVMVLLALISVLTIFFTGSSFYLHPTVYAAISAGIYYLLGKFNILMANKMASIIMRVPPMDGVDKFDEATEKHRQITKLIKSYEHMIKQLDPDDFIEPKDRDRMPSPKIDINIPVYDDDGKAIEPDEGDDN